MQSRSISLRLVSFAFGVSPFLSLRNRSGTLVFRKKQYSAVSHSHRIASSCMHVPGNPVRCNVIFGNMLVPHGSRRERQSRTGLLLLPRLLVPVHFIILRKRWGHRSCRWSVRSLICKSRTRYLKALMSQNFVEHPS